MDFEFTAELWIWDGPAAWHFITVPADVSEVIRAHREPSPRGFGSVRVIATIGTSSWKTSIFPQSSDGTYVLPVKKQIRATEDLSIGDEVELRIELAD